MNTVFYNSHHSPIGAFSSFTLGMKGAKGGLGCELSGPANEEVYIGLEDASGSTFQAFPFFEEAHSKAEDYDVEGLSEFDSPRAIRFFPEQAIQRTFGAGIDEWRAGDLTFRVITPPQAIPDPTAAPEDQLKTVLIPAVRVELEVDNRNGTRARRAFFGYRGTERSYGMRPIRQGGLVGIGQHNLTGIATLDPDVYCGIAFQAEKVLMPTAKENLEFLVGNVGLLVGEVPAGERRTFRFAVGFFREGLATTGIETRYYYRRYYSNLEEVLRQALEDFDGPKQLAIDFDQKLNASLSPDRAWMTAQAIRSYYGSTQLLERSDGSPLWVVNEGEYRMMNTFDLTVDQAFFELSLNPWTVRNVLDLYAERYSYEDTVVLPADPSEHAGGLAFTHDMGVGNVFSREQHSGYEQAKLKGCFSYMSAEELMNWVLSAGLYYSHTRDIAWAVTHRRTFLQCLESLCNRDHWDPCKRNGVVGMDSQRCEGGSEITTYDSLDTSLGQARNNLYLAVKGWASYCLLEKVLHALDEMSAANVAAEQAEKAVATIVAAKDADGVLPAVIGEGCNARIIPAIEALVYPFVAGLPIDDELRMVLTHHFRSIMRRGVCKFDDGGWKLSSTSQNSWLSKIYLCQFVSEQVLGFKKDEDADRAHRKWLESPKNAYFAWSDQMLAGKAVGSRYYPRGVTSILWLANGTQPLNEVQSKLRDAERTSA